MNMIKKQLLVLNYKLIVLAVWVYAGFAFSSVHAKGSLIKQVNLTVSIIAKNIKKEKFAILKMEHSADSEVGPPVITFYYEKTRAETLRAVIIIASHETWSNKFAYYFGKKGQILKYSKTTSRPDNPPKLAIIYHNGKKMWSNTSEPRVEIVKIKTMFGIAMKSATEFQQY
ncbi:hypothetical protein MNBD_GAMMA12-2750 [hydrothermal vent metagenome]|uniref:Uncharacterized protein n=1 Tax=hydrothermal vent metagenome TaxID=652676 RepID=A0A3B0YYU1_9ZZZZ